MAEERQRLGGPRPQGYSDLFGEFGDGVDRRFAAPVLPAGVLDGITSTPDRPGAAGADSSRDSGKKKVAEPPA